jgi:hypothetical protein
MSDPLSRVPATDPPDLFSILPPIAPTVREESQAAAARSSAERYRQISHLLSERGPLAGWQIAEALGCQLHQISGRLTEMRTNGQIENTGERRKNPRTNTTGEVVRLADVGQP